MPKRFQVYLSAFCPYCTMARQLLDEQGYDYEVIRVDTDAVQRSVMEARSGRITVPQVFLGDAHIGGYDALAALQRSGRLNGLVASTDGRLS